MGIQILPIGFAVDIIIVFGWLVRFLIKKKCHLINCFVLLVWNELLNFSYTFKNCWKYIMLDLFFSVFTLWPYWNILKVSFLKVSIKLALCFFYINPCTDSFRELFNTTNDYQEYLVVNFKIMWMVIFYINLIQTYLIPSNMHMKKDLYVTYD